MSKYRQGLSLPFTDCFNFFDFLYSDCPKDGFTNIWEWSPNTACNHINSKWNAFSDYLVHSCSIDVKVSFTEFEKLAHTTRSGDITVKLKAVKKDVDNFFIFCFLSSIIHKLIHHRNLLKQYRTLCKDIIEFLNLVYLEYIYEPQPLHWNK